MQRRQWVLGTEAVVAAYRRTSDVGFRASLLQALDTLCWWHDNAAIAHEFAKTELAGATQAQLVPLLEEVRDEAYWSLEHATRLSKIASRTEADGRQAPDGTFPTRGVLWPWGLAACAVLLLLGLACFLAMGRRRARKEPS